MAKDVTVKMVWYFIGVNTKNGTLHNHLKIQIFSSCVEKYSPHLLYSLVKYCSYTGKETSYRCNAM